MKLGLKDVSVTTNGQFVLRKLDTLLDSGLKRASTSAWIPWMRTAFGSIARSGDLATVLGGLSAL